MNGSMMSLSGTPFRLVMLTERVRISAEAMTRPYGGSRSKLDTVIIQRGR